MKRFAFLVAVLLLVSGLSACSDSSNDTVSRNDQRLMSEASRLAEQFQKSAFVFYRDMSNGDFEQAELTIDDMRDISADRLELVGRIENGKIRSFYIGVQRFTERSINLYQDFLNATLTGASDSELDRLAAEEVRIVSDFKAYLRAESKKLFDLDDQTAKNLIAKQIQRSEAEFRNEAQAP